MTIYNVQLYREMRLRFGGIEADSPEAAAEAARRLTLRDADDLDECDGADFAALVDVAGDEGFHRSVTVEFEGEGLRKAAPELLAALTLARRALNAAPRFRVGDTDSYRIASVVDEAIAKAGAA